MDVSEVVIPPNAASRVPDDQIRAAIGADGSALDRELIATAGEHIAVERVRPTDGPPIVCLIETDAAGRLASAMKVAGEIAGLMQAQVRFDEREAESIGPQRGFLAFDRATAARDWEGVRSSLADSCMIVDHRSRGVGTMTRDRWIQSATARAELVPNLQSVVLRILAYNRRGRVRQMALVGAFPDGTPVRRDFVATMTSDGTRITLLELYDIPDADRAVARFDELCGSRSG